MSRFFYFSFVVEIVVFSVVLRVVERISLFFMVRGRIRDLPMDDI